MDANSTLTIGFIFMILGAIGTIVGILTNRDTKKIREGKLEGIIETQMANIQATLQGHKDNTDQIIAEVKADAKETREEVKKIDNRLVAIETSHKANHRPRAVAQ